MSADMGLSSDGARVSASQGRLSSMRRRKRDCLAAASVTAPDCEGIKDMRAGFRIVVGSLSNLRLIYCASGASCPYWPDFSLHGTTMRLEAGPICPPVPTRLVTIAQVRQTARMGRVHTGGAAEGGNWAASRGGLQAP